MIPDKNKIPVMSSVRGFSGIDSPVSLKEFFFTLLSHRRGKINIPPVIINPP